jgi:hypothetical protein
MRSPSTNNWVTDGKSVKISTRILRRGCFYLCNPFYLKSSECNDPSMFTKGSEILVPTLVQNLTIKPTTKFDKLPECHSYADLDSEHRFEYVGFLQGQILPLVSNKSLIEYYLRGIAIRLFLDSTTTEADRIQIYERLLLFYNACLKYRKLIEPLVAITFCRLFISVDNERIIFFPISESVKTNRLIRNLAKLFYDSFSGVYQLRCLLSGYGSYVITGIDSERQPVSIEVTLPDELINTPKIKTKIYEAYELFTLKQRKLKDLEDKAKRQIGHTESTARSILFGSNDPNDKSIEIVKAFYNRIIDENEYITTNYAEIVKSFGFTEHPIHLAADIFSDEILGKLISWGFYTYPDIRKLNLVLYSKSPCILYKDTSGSPVIKSSRYKTLMLFIKLALYVVQEDEYNWNDIQHIKHFIAKHAPNERTKKELVSILLLSLKDVQRLNSLKQEVNIIEKSILNDLIISLKTLAYVDREVTRERKDQLEWLLPVLGCNVRNLSSELRQILPVDYSKKQPIQVSLDLNMLKKLQEDTVLAHELLNEIFVDETEDSVKHDKAPTHISLLKRLLDKEVWSISEVKDLCHEYGMMYGAFIEKANDYAYSKVDDLILEESDEYIYVITQYKDML